MLRELPGVDEAMVVGEGRPFCAALLWVDETNRDEASQAVLDAALVELNRDLVHPEQVKRWAVLTDDLSVDSGELTAEPEAPAAGRSPSVRPGGGRLVRGRADARRGFHVGVAPREGAIA